MVNIIQPCLLGADPINGEVWTTTENKTQESVTAADPSKLADNEKGKSASEVAKDKT